MKMKNCKTLLSILFLIISLFLAKSLWAALITVNSELDKTDSTPGDGICETSTGNNECTLRAAIQEANANGADDTINLSAGNYILSLGNPDEDSAAEGDLDILSNLNIDGGGARETTIDGNANDRVFHINGAISVTLAGLTIRNGLISSGNGGGIFQEGGSLTIFESTILGNHFKNDGSSDGGGGIFNSGGILLLQNSTISNNDVDFGQGGGIFNFHGELDTEGSTISGNTCSGEGGGLFLYSANTTITNSTITQNESDGQGGGINGEVTIGNSILAGNVSDVTPSNASDCHGGMTSLGFNIIGRDCDPAAPATGDQVGDSNNAVVPLLGPLQNNGGPTDTHSLLTGSPAIDAGDPNNCPATDQRGVTRPQGDACDIGAFELAPTDDANGNGIPDNQETNTGNNNTDATSGGCAIANLSTSPSGFLWGVFLAMGMIGLLWRVLTGINKSEAL